MTTYASPTSASTRSVAPLGVAAAVVAAAGTTYGAHGWTEVLVTVPVILVTAALVFGVAVPRALGRENAGGIALGLSVPAAVLLLPAFWAGVPLVLAVGGMVVGSAGRTGRSGSGKSVAALVIGALVVLGWIAIYASEIATGTAGFLLG